MFRDVIFKKVNSAEKDQCSPNILILKQSGIPHPLRWAISPQASAHPVPSRQPSMGAPATTSTTTPPPSESTTTTNRKQQQATPQSDPPAAAPDAPPKKRKQVGFHHSPYYKIRTIVSNLRGRFLQVPIENPKILDGIHP
jgi:hypothetical protein